MTSESWDMTRFSNWIIGLVVVLIFASAWYLLNRPANEQPWEGDVGGLTYTPYRISTDVKNRIEPSREQLTGDIEKMAGITGQIRTYETTGAAYDVPEIASRMGLRVTTGAWIGNDLVRNETEVKNLIDLAHNVGGVNQLLVGNEVLYRQELNFPGDPKDEAERASLRVDRLITYIKRVKDQVDGMPVSTSETFDYWLPHPTTDKDGKPLAGDALKAAQAHNADVTKLVNAVDFIAVHILPFWNGVKVENAVDSKTDGNAVMQVYHRLQQTYPDKRIVVTEVGWPSQGLTRGQAEASPVNQGTFLRRFLLQAKKENIDYFIIEAFDQPWKIQTGGGVEAYWGLWDGNGNPKPALAGVLVNNQNWRALAIATIALGLPFVLWVLRASLDLNRRGRVFIALLVQGGVMTTIAIYALYSTRYLTWVDIAALAMVAPATLLLIIIFLIEGAEMALNLWLGKTNRRLAPPPIEGNWKLPKVSVHVPCYNEPPEMMIETIQALERLDYPNYEVLIIDNNTKDEAVWKPVEAYIKSLNKPNFRFFHLPNWPGYKAGALNFAITETDPDAQIIATIDSDYQVRSDWLKTLVPHFADPQVALVQAPQDYSDGKDGLFKRMCFWEYAGFFYLGMRTRDEKNAIIQHGTMALIRTSALKEVGGWAEWCITEDAELGLRLFEAGHRAIYTEKSYGKGLMPDSFEAYRKQRYRWAYGAMQILKGHWRDLMPFGRPGRLNPSQRYQFLAGWMPWIADGLQLLFVAMAILWSIGTLVWPRMIEPPLTLFLVVTLGMFFFKVGKSMWLYASKVPCGALDNFYAAIAGLALSHAVAKAVWRGLFTSNLPFHRTPKMENSPAVIRALVSAREEAVICLALLGCAIALLWERGLDVSTIIGQFTGPTWTLSLNGIATALSQTLKGLISIDWVIQPDACMWAALLAIQALPFFCSVVMAMISAFPNTQQPAVPSIDAGKLLPSANAETVTKTAA
ncbi:glycosyltransferase [Dongia soli]|uniref:Glycosyltransferase n=1 Tax=Dongia soli TaxID=600628 RepID=A0ABU5E7A8_9PROT|nr:glycosyltransferase [Dongia soli]MDY0882197.1 glycosyltransferase [Dongia soli]